VLCVCEGVFFWNHILIYETELNCERICFKLIFVIEYLVLRDWLEG
jgi:hypothetical protein